MSTLSPDEILEKKGIKLPPAPAPKGLYKPFLISSAREDIVPKVETNFRHDRRDLFEWRL